MSPVTQGAFASSGRRPRRGVSLVEVLVLIGIVGLLVAILVPALARASRAAKITVDLSNQRQLAGALFAFHSDRGVIPTVSEAVSVRQADPNRRQYLYRPDGTALNWIESIVPYLSNPSPSLFRCPRDSGIVTGRGYLLPSDIGGERVLVSYALNADLAAVNVSVDGVKRTLLGPGDFVGVYASSEPYPGEAYHGIGAGGKLTRVSDAAGTLLLGDCGTIRSMMGPSVVPDPLDRPDVLAFTSNYMAFNDGSPAGWGRLSGALETPWLATRLPLDRHDESALNAAGNLPNSMLPPTGYRGRLAIGFVDGHAAAVEREDFSRVKITPFRLGSPSSILSDRGGR